MAVTTTTLLSTTVVVVAVSFNSNLLLSYLSFANGGKMRQSDRVWRGPRRRPADITEHHNRRQHCGARYTFAGLLRLYWSALVSKQITQF
jgi:hypothetical protein